MHQLSSQTNTHTQTRAGYKDRPRCNEICQTAPTRIIQSVTPYLGRWKRCLSPRTQRWHTPARQQGWGTWIQLRCPASSAGPPPAQCRAPWKLRKHTRDSETDNISSFQKAKLFPYHWMSSDVVTHDDLNVIWEASPDTNTLVLFLLLLLLFFYYTRGQM